MIKKVSKDRVASDQAPISSTRSFVVEEEEEEENVRTRGENLSISRQIVLTLPRFVISP